MPAVCVAQVALAVTSATLPSENVPVAVKWRVMPTPVCSVAGAMTMDWIVAAIVVSASVPLRAARRGRERGGPSVSASARPVAAPMSATAGALDVQVTAPVMSAVWPSANVPVATKRCEMPSGSVPVAGRDGDGRQALDEGDARDARAADLQVDLQRAVGQRRRARRAPRVSPACSVAAPVTAAPLTISWPALARHGRAGARRDEVGRQRDAGRGRGVVDAELVARDHAVAVLVEPLRERVRRRTACRTIADRCAATLLRFSACSLDASACRLALPMSAPLVAMSACSAGEQRVDLRRRAALHDDAGERRQHVAAVGGGAGVERAERAGRRAQHDAERGQHLAFRLRARVREAQAVGVEQRVDARVGERGEHVHVEHRLAAQVGVRLQRDRAVGGRAGDLVGVGAAWP